MTLQDLQNVQVFMRRAPMTGEEAIGWCQAWAALQTEIATRAAPVSQVPTPSEPSS